jgi:hypothetical protein
MEREKEFVTVTVGGIIDCLVQSDLDDISMNMEKLEDILYSGFIGYQDRSVDELIEEYKAYLNPEFPDDVVVTIYLAVPQEEK